MGKVFSTRAGTDARVLRASSESGGKREVKKIFSLHYATIKNSPHKFSRKGAEDAKFDRNAPFFANSASSA
jgi:transposase